MDVRGRCKAQLAHGLVDAIAIVEKGTLRVHFKQRNWRNGRNIILV